MNLSDIPIFNAVADTLSFTRAAQHLGLSRSAVSKRIARLEKDTDVLLFQRSARSIRLTPAGERFYDQTAALDTTIRRATEALQQTQDVPFGRLSLTMPTSLGAQFTPLLVREFRSQWPQVQLNIDYDDRYADLAAEGFDVAIRVAKRLGDSSQPAKSLMTSSEVLVASPGYLERFGRPQTLRELRRHCRLALAKQDSAWQLHGPNGPESVRLDQVTTFNNDLAMILAAVLDGGIFLTPRILVESEIKSGRLVVVLPRYKTPTDYKVWAVYRTLQPTAKVRMLIRFVEDWLPRLGDLDRWQPLQGHDGSTR